MAVTPEEARQRMVERQLAGRGIRDVRVLEAMGRVPRHEFVPLECRAEAYADRPLPIGQGQTISQPYMVAIMTEALAVQPGERVLEIGTGSGYQAAVLAEMGAVVCSMERIPEIAAQARTRLSALGYEAVDVRCDDGALGWPGGGDFDAILVTAAARELPRELLRVLRPAGRLVVPIGDEDEQQLVRVRRTPQGWREDYLGACRFVKLVGRHGWEQP